MKLLLDQNISHKLISKLATIYPNSKHVSELNLHTASDVQIWNYARDNKFAIVTQDSDFNDYGTVYGYPPKIVWLRTGNATTRDIERVLIENRNTIKEFYKDENVGVLSIF